MKADLRYACRIISLTTIIDRGLVAEIMVWSKIRRKTRRLSTTRSGSDSSRARVPRPRFSPWSGDLCTITPDAVARARKSFSSRYGRRTYTSSSRASGDQLSLGRTAVRQRALPDFRPRTFKFTGTKLPKSKWKSTHADEDWYCFASLWRPSAKGDDAFAILTAAPGPEVAPIHDCVRRQTPTELPPK